MTLVIFSIPVLLVRKPGLIVVRQLAPLVPRGWEARAAPWLPAHTQRPAPAPSLQRSIGMTFTRCTASAPLSYNLLICIIGSNNYFIHWIVMNTMHVNEYHKAKASSIL